MTTTKLPLPDVKKYLEEANRIGLQNIDPQIVQQILDEHPKELLKWSVSRYYSDKD